MKRLIVSILAILATLVGVVALVLLTLPLWFDPNDYKDDIARLVEERTGRNLAIEGDLSLSYYPWLGLEARGMRLSNPPGFGDAPFLQTELAGASVALLPLLKGEVQLDTVHLRGAEVHLIRTADGQTNWDDLAGGAPPEAEQAPTEEPSDPSQALGALAVAGVDIRDARLIWDDRSAGQRIVVQDMRLATDAFGPGRTTTVEGGLRLDSEQPALSSRITYQGRVRVADDLQRFGLQDFRIEAETGGAALPGGQPINALLLTDAELDLSAETLDIPNLRLTAADVTAEAHLGVRGLLSEPKASGELRVPPFNLRQTLARFGLDDLQTADPEALTQAQLQAQFTGSATEAALEDLVVQLDDTRLTGRAGAPDLAAPAYTFDLAIDAINVDRYLPPAQDDTAKSDGEDATAPTQGGATSPGGAAAGGATEIPVDTLRDLNLDGTLRIGELQVTGLQAAEIQVATRAQNGQVRIQPRVGRFYEGGYRGDITIDARGGDTPTFTTDERVEAVQLGPLLQDAMGQDRLTGTAQIRAQLEGRGDTVEDLRRSLGGTANANITDGTVRGINIAQMIREAYARIRGEPVPEQQGPQQTDFSALTADAKLNQGVADTTLLLQSPLLRVNGDGDVNLVEESLDYLVRAAIVGTLEGQGGRTLDELKGVVIPIRLSGPLTEPDYSIDLKQALTEAQKEVVREKRDEVKEELKGKVQDRLQNLFNR